MAFNIKRLSWLRHKDPPLACAAEGHTLLAVTSEDMPKKPHLCGGRSCFSANKEETASRVTPLIIGLAMSDYHDQVGWGFAASVSFLDQVDVTPRCSQVLFTAVLPRCARLGFPFPHILL